MPFDSNLGLYFDIAANPAQAIQAVEQFGSSTTASMEALRAELEAVKAELASTQAQMEELATTGSGRVTSGMTEARLALRGVGEEIGVTMPRFVSTFLASVGGVGPIMAAAFAPIAIIGLIEVLGRIPAKAEEVINYLSGWGEKEKKIFQDAQTEIEKTGDKFAEFQAKLTQARGGDEVDALNAKLKLQYAQLTQLNVEMEHLRDSEKMFGEESQVGHQLRVNGIEKEIKAIQATRAVKVEEINDTQRALEIAQETEKKKTAEWFAEEEGRAEKHKEEMIKKAQEEANKRYNAMTEYLRKLFARYDEEEKSHEEYVKAAVAIEDEKFKFYLDAENHWYASVTRQEEQLTKDLEKTTRERVKLVEEQYKAWEKAEHEQALDNERLNRELLQQEKQRTRERIQDFKEWGQVGEAVLGSLGGAFKQHHALEIALMVGRAAVRTVMEIAEGLSASAFGDAHAAALHFAAAAEFAAVGAINAFTAGVTGGSGGGSSSSSGYGGGPSGGLLPPSMANVGQGYGGNVHIYVVSQDGAGIAMANLIKGAAQNSGAMVVATHTADGRRL